MQYNGKEIYTEPPGAADGYRRAYQEGIDRFIQNLSEQGKDVRTAFFPWSALPEQAEEYRRKYREMLGIPLVPEGIFGEVRKEFVATDEVCHIYRVVLNITEEIPFYGMLLIPKNGAAPMPLVIAQHGGGGTPELCSDFHGNNNYSHMVQRALARGAAVFAPQLLLWNAEEASPTCPKYDAPYDRAHINGSLKRFGLSVAGIQIAGISKAIDYLSELPEIDGEKNRYGGSFLRRVFHSVHHGGRHAHPRRIRLRLF